MFYEAILVFALLLLAGFLYIPIFGSIHGPFQKAIFQFYLLAVMMIYFVTFWRQGGQTLPMKTWHIRLARIDGSSLSAGQGIIRFTLAAMGTLCMGAGYLWALVDPEGQFLHDRICNTQITETLSTTKTNVPPGA